MSTGIEIGLHAVVVAVDGEQPLVLSVVEEGSPSPAALPFGPFQPAEHRTLDTGLRNWVEEQTQLTLGYVEQLYTFGDKGRRMGIEAGDVSFVSVGYLALVRKPEDDQLAGRLAWNSWYEHFPWEDWRNGPSKLLTGVLLPALAQWVRNAPDMRSSRSGLDRLARLRLAFGCDLPPTGTPTIENWDDERVLERYELMYEAGMVEEAVRDGRRGETLITPPPGRAMLHDHRRILATAMARLRAKLKYRPVVFELMPEEFTLTELQRTVETLSGQRVHKQNFRRMVENADLVEPTGGTSANTGGRPAAIFRFRRSIMRERPAPGLRIGSRG